MSHSLDRHPSPPAPSAEAPLLWLDDLWQLNRQQTRWLWQGYLAAGGITLLTSQWKAGKTTLLAVLLDRMKAGDVAGLTVTAGKAVVLSEEAPEHWLRHSALRGSLRDSTVVSEIVGSCKEPNRPSKSLVEGRGHGGRWTHTPQPPDPRARSARR